MNTTKLGVLILIILFVGFGIYYFFIEAYDTAFNLATKNTSLTLVIFLNEIISLEFDFANITVNIGYIGEDNIDFLVAFRAYDSVKGGFENVADINITLPSVSAVNTL